MTEEIKKLIEIEANNRFSHNVFRAFTDIEKNIAITEFKYGGLFVLSKWQEDERWRKFGTDDLPKIGMRILLRVGERYDTTVICSHSHIHSLSEVFTEWKPIL